MDLMTRTLAGLVTEQAIPAAGPYSAARSRSMRRSA